MQLTLAGVGVFTFSEPGWTANSDDGTIVNNSFTLPDPPQGDFNGDLLVDAADYVSWRNSLGTLVDRYTGADGNGNGFIEANDYVDWKSHFGETSASPVGLTALVPEPRTLIQPVVALLVTILRRRRSSRLSRR